MSGKVLSSRPEGSNAKRNREEITPDIKADALKRLDAGKRQSYLAKTLNLAMSTLCTNLTSERTSTSNG